MTFDIPSEFEPVIKNAVALGIFANEKDALTHALALLAEEQGLSVENGVAEPAEGEPHDAWAKRLQAFTASCRPTEAEVDDSRDSIYPDQA